MRLFPRLAFTLVFPLVIASAAQTVTRANAQSSDHKKHGAKHPYYLITDLGTLGGPYSNSFGINERDHVGGSAVNANGNLLAYLWTPKQGMQSLGTLLGGKNSAASGPNNHDLVPVISETDIADPYQENFCGFGTPFLCVAGVWRNDILTLLPPLVPLSPAGGNSYQNTVSNDRGVVVGFAENGVLDPACSLATSSLAFDFQAVLWDSEERIHKLSHLKGDTVAAALSVNNAGQVVGGSGLCSNTPLFPFLVSPHAVLWNDAAHPIPIPGLGGTKDNLATAINNFGQVLGVSSLPGDKTIHAYLWMKPMRHPLDLGTLAGDQSSIPGGLRALNDDSEAVGQSCDSTNPFTASAICRAFLWHHGHMLDLNELTDADGNPSQLQMFFAFGINNRGDITGWAATPDGEVHAFVALRQNGH